MKGKVDIYISICVCYQNLRLILYNYVVKTCNVLKKEHGEELQLKIRKIRV